MGGAFKKDKEIFAFGVRLNFKREAVETSWNKEMRKIIK